MTQKLITLFVLISFLTNKLNAQDGTLDLTFGTSGKVITKASTSGWDVAYDIAIQTDQKIVVCGESPVNGSAMLVMRYNNDGTLDNTFDGDGKVTIDITNVSEDAYSLAIQEDGKILIAGKSPNIIVTPQQTSGIAMVRLNTDGSIDSTFGVNGIVRTPIGTVAEAKSIKTQSDGKIVIAGMTDTLGSFGKGLIVRYNSNGTLDNTFASNGIFTIAFNDIATRFDALSFQSDGKIVATGYTASTPHEIFIVRLLTNGTIDNTFGFLGFNHFSFSTVGTRSYAIGLNSFGKIIIGGYSSISPTISEMLICQLDNGGNLDNSFGTNGIVKIAIGNTYNYVKDLLVQSDNKIILVGSSTIGGQGDNFALVKLKSNGTLDSSFNSVGYVTTDFISGSNDYGNALTMQADGKILVAGYLYNNNGDVDVALSRYNNSSQILSISESINNSNFKIFPNPSNSEFSIVHSLDPNKLVTIYNQTGQIVVQQKLHESETKINTQYWLKGVYIIKIEGIYQKIIIQ